MDILWRAATSDDIAPVVALLHDDMLGATREGSDPEQYRAAFRRMAEEGANHLIVGEAASRIVATYQITFISGLSPRAARRAQVESVRVHSEFRGRGIGAAMMDDAESRARAAGCSLIQLTTNAARSRARAFYMRLGFTPSHIGFKRDLT